MTGLKACLRVFKRLLKNTARYAHEYQREQWFLENYSHSPFIPEEIRNREIPAMSECVTLIQRGMEQGLIRKINPIMCVQMINGMLTVAIQGACLENTRWTTKTLSKWLRFVGELL